ncbi:hypothetical protein NST17_20385 [Caldifermentibacillus hisashii]|uniref:Uncharacterized protein n=1 Tax=Caldifermentibacillus hisashii TaxID=996558 RepID=A0ABU9K337_9BACI
MSSACTCHINPETCWWCLYEKEKEKVNWYEATLKKIKLLAKCDEHKNTLEEIYEYAENGLKKYKERIEF